LMQWLLMQMNWWTDWIELNRPFFYINSHPWFPISCIVSRHVPLAQSQITKPLMFPGEIWRWPDSSLLVPEVAWTVGPWTAFPPCPECNMSNMSNDTFMCFVSFARYCQWQYGMIQIGWDAQGIEL
jgi:hypothetical protein